MRKKLIRALRKVSARSSSVHLLISSLYLLLGNKGYLADIEKALENSDLNDAEHVRAIEALARDLREISFQKRAG